MGLFHFGRRRDESDFTMLKPGKNVRSETNYADDRDFSLIECVGTYELEDDVIVGFSNDYLPIVRYYENKGQTRYIFLKKAFNNCVRNDGYDMKAISKSLGDCLKGKKFTVFYCWMREFSVAFGVPAVDVSKNTKISGHGSISFFVSNEDLFKTLCREDQSMTVAEFRKEWFDDLSTIVKNLISKAFEGTADNASFVPLKEMEIGDELRKILQARLDDPANYGTEFVDRMATDLSSIVVKKVNFSQNLFKSEEN